MALVRAKGFAEAHIKRPYVIKQDWLQSSGIIASHTCGGHRMGGLSGIAAGLKDDRYIVHVEYKGKGWPCGFLGDKNALSGGWVAFAKANELDEGDVGIFEFQSQDIIKMYLFPKSGNGDEAPRPDVSLENLEIAAPVPVLAAAPKSKQATPATSKKATPATSKKAEPKEATGSKKKVSTKPKKATTPAAGGAAEDAAQPGDGPGAEDEAEVGAAEVPAVTPHGRAPRAAKAKAASKGYNETMLSKQADDEPKGKKSTGKGKGAKSTGKATALKAGQKRTRRESDNGESDGSGSSSSSGSESDSGSAEKDVEEVEEEAGPSSRPATSNKRARKSAAGGAPRAHKAAAPRARKAGAGEGGTEEGEEEEDMTYPTKKSVLPALSCKEMALSGQALIDFMEVSHGPQHEEPSAIAMLRIKQPELGPVVRAKDGAILDPPVGLEFRGFCSTAFLWDPSYGHRPVHVYDENGNMLEDLDQ